MEIELKEKEYSAYIREHVSNVQMAYIKYGDKLSELLNVSPTELLYNVMNHDESKWSDEEFEAYRQYYYPCSDEKPNKEVFNTAWEHHYRNNPHHPQYWQDKDNNIIKDMPAIYIAEMLLDWEAMSMKFNDNTYDYYMKERNIKPFSDNTRKILDQVITIFKSR